MKGEVRKGEKYTVTLEHVGTDPEYLAQHGHADYDYTATIDLDNGIPPHIYQAKTLSQDGSVIVTDDEPSNFLGRHEPTPEGAFYAENATGTLYVAKATLEMSQTTMTLKHDNQCQLNIVTEPAGIEFSEKIIQIRDHDSSWYTLATNSPSTWTTGIAGHFDLRVYAKIKGHKIYSTTNTATVQFPDRSQILSNTGVITTMEAKWQKTLADSTPTQCREHSFIVYLDTCLNTYYTALYTEGAWAPPGTNASVVLDLRDDPSRLPNADGNKYQVATFHTHPPETYSPTNIVRNTGPSTYFDDPINNDIAVSDDWGIPGFVYDYSAPQVQGGHSETDPAHIYQYGPTIKILP